MGEAPENPFTNNDLTSFEAEASDFRFGGVIAEVCKKELDMDS